MPNKNMKVAGERTPEKLLSTTLLRHQSLIKTL